ncbi:hypothetical protein ACRAWD_14820 [Caulobacter segnis]
MSARRPAAPGRAPLRRPAWSIHIAKPIQRRRAVRQGRGAG